MINPSSKMTLKASCLQACGNDVDKAQKLYKFFSEDIASLPDFDVPPPTMMQQATRNVGSLFGWVKENKEDLFKAWDLIQSFRGGSPRAVMPPVAPPIDIPPIPAP